MRGSANSNGRAQGQGWRWSVGEGGGDERARGETYRELAALTGADHTRLGDVLARHRLLPQPHGFEGLGLGEHLDPNDLVTLECPELRERRRL